MHARHGQVQQDEIGVGGGGQPLGQLVQRARLQHLRVVERVAERLAQRAAKQRMIVDDDKAIARHTVHPYAYPAERQP